MVKDACQQPQFQGLILCVIFCWLITFSTADKCAAGTKGCDHESVTRFSVFTALPRDHETFKQDLHYIVPLSRAEPGVIEYKMYENPSTPGTFGFIEKWNSASALKTHLEGENMKKLFDNQYYEEIKTTEENFGPWREVTEDPERKAIDMTFYWVMDCPKKYIWDIITDWTNASWAEGRPHSEIIDPEGKIQKRYWPGRETVVKVKMLEKDETNFITKQEILDGWITDRGVTFDTFYVTITLSDENIDSETQSKMRYNTKATLSKGTVEQARDYLKSDYYKNRKPWYLNEFNCGIEFKQKKALTQIQNLYDAISGNNFRSEAEFQKAATPFFATTGDTNSFSHAVLSGISSESFSVRLIPGAIINLRDLRVVGVEDILISTGLEAHVTSRVVIYQINGDGKITTTRVFAANQNNVFARASLHFYDVFSRSDVSKLKALFSSDGVAEIADIGNSKTTDITKYFNDFFSVKKSAKIKPQRTYVLGNQVAQVVEFHSGDEVSREVHMLTFNQNLEVYHFEVLSKIKLNLTRLKVK